MHDKHLALDWGCDYCLQADLLNQFKRTLLLRVGGREDLEGRCVGSGGGRAAGVAYDGGKSFEQGREAVRGRTIVQRVASRFGQRRLGALSRCHRIARALGCLVGVGEQQLAPGFAHMPFNVVGEHAQQDVRTHPIGAAVVDRTHLQIHRLERAKRALDTCPDNPSRYTHTPHSARSAVEDESGNVKTISRPPTLANFTSVLVQTTGASHPGDHTYQRGTASRRVGAGGAIPAEPEGLTK